MMGVYDPGRGISISSVAIFKEKSQQTASAGSPWALEKWDVPVISIISRLTAQKGLELIRAVFHEMIEENVQFVVLGSGDWEYEQFFREAAAGRTQIRSECRSALMKHWQNKFIPPVDVFLMPSKFEPCGLGQLIAMRYGALPFVRETGGLNDTVQSYDEESKSGNGFSFTNFNAHDMLYTYRRAIRSLNRKTCGQGL